MTAPVPYWSRDGLALYLGDCREILPALGVQADLVLTDPPYADTDLAWDVWPKGWVAAAASVSSSMWCFGSMRMFLRFGAEFEASGWKFSQDLIWEKNTGTNPMVDRFRRIHEHALHFYRGRWDAIRHATPRIRHPGARIGVMSRQRQGRAGHLGHYGPSIYVDDGTRLHNSVIHHPNMLGKGIHTTQKPAKVLQPLLMYGCPRGGLVVDPFAGSASTLWTAMQLGRRAIGIEGSEEILQRAVDTLESRPW
ncbi:site-specific DNA-methyltransferase [Streptosporangium sp. NPDC020072]|uniref:DNA-methyltransferase n=1 Tax=Streptosporangium sp. NPDC020072 TaxID=3154788 RepID=UPI00341302EE